MTLLHQVWRMVTSTRRRLAFEDEVTRQRAEMNRQGAEIARQRAEIDRLRAENRALLNSILGIAGVPPILVTAPTDQDVACLFRGEDAGDQTAFSDADRKSLGSEDPSYISDRSSATRRSSDTGTVGARIAVPGEDACRDAAHSSPPPAGCNSEAGQPLDGAEESAFSAEAKSHSRSLPATASGTQAQRTRIRERRGWVRDDKWGPVRRSFAAAAPVLSEAEQVNAACRTAPSHANRAGLKDPALRSNLTAPGVTIKTPLRRRSWQQISRMFEFQSARKAVASGE